MEELNILSTGVVAHFLISGIPWLVGIVAGGGLGVLCALGIHALFSARPELRRPSVMLPWRTLVMGLLMVAWSPFIVVFLGLGAIAGGAMVGAWVFLLALAFTAATLIEHWHPSPLSVQLIAGARTLAVASGMIAIGVGVIGGGGIGHLILEGVRLLQYDLMWRGLLTVIALALVLDLLLGVVQAFALNLAGMERPDGSGIEA